VLLQKVVALYVMEAVEALVIVTSVVVVNPAQPPEAAIE
jgi:hypothetical protein